MKFQRRKIKDNKYVIEYAGEKHKLSKTYFYDYYYETEEYFVVSYKIMLTSGLEFMLVRKLDMVIIKQNIQDITKLKKLIKILEGNF